MKSIQTKVWHGDIRSLPSLLSSLAFLGPVVSSQVAVLRASSEAVACHPRPYPSSPPTLRGQRAPFEDHVLRQHIWKSLLPASLPLADDVDLAALAMRYELSGGPLAAIIAKVPSQPTHPLSCMP